MFHRIFLLALLCAFKLSTAQAADMCPVTTPYAEAVLAGVSGVAYTNLSGWYGQALAGNSFAFLQILLFGQSNPEISMVCFQLAYAIHASGTLEAVTETGYAWSWITWSAEKVGICLDTDVMNIWHS